jgi:ribose transport system ATP-binding protein
MRLEMRGVRKAFGATVALNRVDFGADAGEVHAVIGENGAGKSTLMKILAGALKADAGSIELDGRRYHPASPIDARRQGVAMVYQELSLAPHLTVEENVLLGQEPGRAGLVDRHEMRVRVERALAQLGRGDLRPEARVADLSPAAQQLTEIARALAQSACRVLILDEPTSSLAADDIERLFATLERLKREGLAVIYISHVLEEVQRVADRFTVLRDGETVGGGAVAGTSASEMVRLMAGRQLHELFPRSARQPGDVVLELKDVAGLDKPQSASLQLRRGEVLGIGGLVGAGRTELLRAIFGLDPIRRGHIRVAAFVGPASPVARLSQGVGFLSEDRKGEGLAVSLSVADNITLSRLEGLGPWRLVLPRRQHAASRAWIGELKIRCAGPGQAVVELSGGSQQKVALARLLHHDVDVLLLDEPTRGIDVASKAQIYQVIDDLARAGRAVLLVSSYLPELLGICDRVAMMTRGVLGPGRPAVALDEHQLLMEATGQA